MVFVFRDINSVVVYIDDIIVFSDNIKNHLEALRRVFERLKKANLKISFKKCNFFKDTIKVLGHIISGGKIMMDPEKIEAVKNWPVPSKVKHIRQFLGLCNSYRKFVKDFAKLALPLTKLTKKDVKWDWTESCQKAFEEFKEKLTSYPVLRAPVMSRKFILYTDAS